MDLRDSKVELAIASIERRAEREAHFRRLYDIYVDRGVLSELSPNENQIVYGRRGVGKTHLFYYFRDYLLARGGPLLFQIIDCQRLGSGLTSVTANPHGTAISLFRELLNDIATGSFESLDQIENNAKAVREAGQSILSFQDVVNKGGPDGHPFDFRNLGDALDRFRNAYGAQRFVLALDEWVAIPPQVQPFLAELVKRTFFTKPEFVIKIAAVTYQAKMAAEHEHRIIGLERGADVFGDIALDTYFVWEEDKPGVESFFGQVIYNHLGDALGWPLDLEPVDKAARVYQAFFTQEEAFIQLCRAAEGNCRDLLNVFRLAYSEFRHDTSSARISISHVRSAAERWYRQDKLGNIAGEGRLEEFLNFLIQEVIRNKKSKTFMVSYRDINHPLLSRLFTARLLHPLRTTWSHPDRPGEPYHLVTMDYGCYVALQGTRGEPSQQVFFFAGDDPGKPEDLVPLDDRRSIRRIVLDRASLDRYASE
jgi:hypothetical protein